MIDLFTDLNIKDVTIGLSDNRRATETQGGAVSSNGYGSRLWGGQVVLQQSADGVGRATQARLLEAVESGQTISVYAPAYEYLQNDPTGKLGDKWNAQTSGSISDNGTTLFVSGIPSDFEFEIGDALSYQYGDNPVRQMFHLITERNVVEEIGGFRRLRVRDFVPGGVPAGTPVQFVKPFFEAMIVPKSIAPPKQMLDRMTGPTFSVVQVLR